MLISDLTLSSNIIRAALGWANVVEEGATGDGSTNDAPRVIDATDRVGDYVNGGTVYFPSRSTGGIYLIGTNITVPANVTWVFDGPAKIVVATGVTVTILGNVRAGSNTWFTTLGTGRVLFDATSEAVRQIYGLDVRSFGAKFDGVSDDLDAYGEAIDALANIPSAGGGVLWSPGGISYLSASLDTRACTALTFLGQGMRVTRFLSGEMLGPAIIYSDENGNNFRFADFHIQREDFATAMPAGGHVAGNFGMANDDTGGNGSGGIIERVMVRGFADSAFYVGGPTGPQVFRDTYAYYCEGYGWEVRTVGGFPPQDISVEGGAAQHIRGGIRSNGGRRLYINRPDIELNDEGLYPCIYTDGGTQTTIFTATCSTGSAATTTPNGIVVLKGETHGSEIIGGLNSAPNGANNLLFGESAGVDHVTVVGGDYSNKLVGGGWFCDFTGAVNVKFTNPFRNLSTYGAGKEKVNDAAANFVNAEGVGCVSDVGSSDDTVTLTKLASMSLVDGVTAPATVSGKARVYVDTADGDLKVKFGDGVVRLLTPDVAGGFTEGATSVADGGTITHGLGITPVVALVTARVSGEFVSVTGRSSTTITVAIKKHDGTAGTTQIVDWRTSY